MSNESKRVFFHAHRTLFYALSATSLTRQFIPERRRTSPAVGTAVAWGSQARKVCKKKKERRVFESFEGKEKRK